MPTNDDLYGDDDFGADDDLGADDEFGISERRVATLLRRKAKLEALLPVVRLGRQKMIQVRLQRINKILAKSGYSADQAAIADAIAASGIEGVGGLEFQVQAPPGIGRLLRLPFYPIDANAATVTSEGPGVASESNPIFIEDGVISAGFTTGEHLLETPAISWAVLRLVGFEVQQRVTKNFITQAGPVLYVRGLQIGGGANLFTHEQFADADIYDADQPEYCGLRDYPIIKSPNTAQVRVQGCNGVTSVNFNSVSCSLLCEVLVDDNYGAHIPGPYARKGAMVRQGGSFV